ncbi:MAG: protein kinase [Pirellulales bacterium]|nr:protein kinase [Pirellulales bacterium]
MRRAPPEDLVALLARLRLAAPADVAGVERRAARLARGVPLFTSVWVDALVSARFLTPFQATEINAHRGEQLQIGPYVVFRKLPGLGFAQVFEGRHLETGLCRRLAVFSVPVDRADATAERLERLVAAAGRLPRDVVAPLEAFGRDATRFWAACDAPPGRTAAEWLIRHGRLPGQIVLELARRMMPGLLALEDAQLCHGDLRAATLLFAASGRPGEAGPRLPLAGLRPAVRPSEGYTHANLPPEAFDGLAPERVRDGAPPNTAGDVYASGCLWWHLLAGRDPLPGGDGLSKLQAAERGAIPDPKPFAPDAPENLRAAIRACTQAAPERRPNLAELTAMLGPTTPASAAVLRRTLAAEVALASSMRSYGTLGRRRLGRKRKAVLAAAAFGLVAAIVLVLFLFGAPWLARPAASPTATTDLPGATQESATTNPSRARQEAAAKPREASPLPDDHGSETQVSAGPKPFLLEAGDAPVARLPLTAGQHVRGPTGARAVVNVAREGLLVDVPGVVFENIDFVWPHSRGAAEAERKPAILILRAPTVELRGCTFRSSDPSVDAVRWIHPSDADRTRLSLPSGQTIVDRCVFRNVATAVDSRTRGATALRFANVLHLGGGPLVRFARAPAADEPTMVFLARTTLRESGPLVEWGRMVAEPVGSISIETNGCVFAPRLDQPLVMLPDDARADALPPRITWTGQGSLVRPGGFIAARRDESGQARALPEGILSIEGLVRSEVEFAGPADGPIKGSRTIRWLAPLQSDEAPGIDPAALAE